MCEREHVDSGLKTEVLRTSFLFHGTVKRSFARPEEVDPFIRADEAAACLVCHPLSPVLLCLRDL